MTGPELKQLREDLGAAVGKRLSVADMAKLCGLAPANGADTIRKWEDGAGPSGPVAALLSILANASDRYAAPLTEATYRLPMRYGDSVVVDDLAAVRLLREFMRSKILRRLS